MEDESIFLINNCVADGLGSPFNANCANSTGNGTCKDSVDLPFPTPAINARKAADKSKQSFASNKAYSQQVDLASQKGKNKETKKGKEPNFVKSATAKKVDWAPKVIEIGESSLPKNQALITEFPTSSYSSKLSSISESNPDSRLMKDFEFLSSHQSRDFASMELKSFISPFSPILLSSCFAPICSKSSHHANPSSSPEESSEKLSTPDGTKKQSDATSTRNRSECTTQATIGVKRGPNEPDSEEGLAFAGQLVQSTFCLSSSETTTNPGLDPDTRGRNGEQPPSANHPDDYPNGLGTKDNPLLGELVERPQLGSTDLDADSGGVLLACGGSRVPLRQQPDDCVQARDESQCNSFPRLRKILEGARGAGQKNAQDRCVLPTDTPTSSSELALTVRGKRSKAKPANKPKPKGRDVIDCLEL
ncbi:hypothetical protein COLO4_21591 [Corchorus olitorius]|uniref:Uncharacterized protein n=1 Tax=Corchorus olitorius TaxID=93759 RepID=A0A1R3ISE3_9ROSI|nr:hypothetical protein COLO4_21591 [Corchorus olitorius]